jgi:hypothetical protein
VTGEAKPRTMLALLVARSDRTHEEQVAGFNARARAMGEPATLSLRQFDRWLAGDLATLPRPTCRRVAEAHWGRPIHELLGPPSAVPVESESGMMPRAVDQPPRPAKALDVSREPGQAPLMNEVRRLDPPESREEKHIVERRQFVNTLSGLALAATPLVRLEALRQGLGHAIGVDRDQWNRIANDYAHDLYSTPHAALCEQLSVDIWILERLLASFPDDRDLERAAAILSMVLAITLTFAGQTWTARRWWRTAREAADKSGDLSVRVMTRSQEAVKGLYDGRPLSHVLSLLDETMALAGQYVCSGLAGALAGRAQALAISGRHREAADAVRHVEEITARMPRAALADESLFGWPEHRLRHTESFVYTEIGDIGRAMNAQERALRVYPDTHATNRAMVQMHRASCFIRDRHVSDGVRYASEVLDALPVEKHDQLLYEVARRAIATVPQNECRRPEFGDLCDRVAALPSR